MPEDNELDVSSEVATETTDAPATDAGGGDFQQDTSQPSDVPPAKPDWKTEKYGPDWESSAEYWRDRSTYWRDETKKAKQQRPQRRIEETTHQEAKPQTQDARPQTPSPYGDVQTVDEFGNRIESRFEQRLAERERQAIYAASIRSARENEKGDPKRGIPPFVEVEQEYLIPFVERNPWAIPILRDSRDVEGNPIDPGKLAHFVGVLIKYKTWDALADALSGRAREELGDRINEVSREAVRVNGRRDGPTSGKLTPEQIKLMSSAEFEKLVARNTGRTP